MSCFEFSLLLELHLTAHLNIMSNNNLSSLGSLTNSVSEPEIKSDRRKRSIPTWILPVGLILGFLSVLGLLFGTRLIPAIPVSVAPVITIRTDSPAEATTPQSLVAPPNSGPGPLLFQASGWVEPDPYPISVPTLVGGIIDEVFVLEGESVKKGQILATLIDEDAVLELRQKQARVQTLKSEIESNRSRVPVVESRRSGSENNIESKRQRLAEMEDRLNRLRSLPRGSIAAIELTSARLQMEQQKSIVAEAESSISGIDSEIEMVKREIEAKQSALAESEVAVARAQLALDRHTIRSPMDGTVLLLHAAPGNKRMIHMDNPKSAYIVELFDPEKLQARIDVPLSEARSLSVGQPVEMSCDLLPNLTLKGEVTRITGEADLQRNTLQVKVAIRNPDSRLRPEMLVRAKFYSIPKPVDKSKPGTTQNRNLAGARLSIFVPRKAVFNNNQLWVVGVQDTAELRTLTLGKEIRDEHQIAIDGVYSGEMVILPPHTNLKEGARVKITK